MVDPLRSNDETGEAADPASPPRMPGWVKWPAIVIGALVLLLLVLRLFGVEHGPGRHMPSDNPPGSVAPRDHTPGGGHG